MLLDEGHAGVELQYDDYKMIQKQQASSFIETFLEFYSTQQFIQEILRQTHHSHMINYRYELTFQKYFQTFLRPFNHQQANACDLLVFSEQVERIHKYNKMSQIVGSIRQSVLNRVKKDQIAPILCCKQNENRIINKVLRQYRVGMIQMRGSNTMHTQSSQKNTKSKCIKVENTIILNQKTSSKSHKNQDVSTETLSKAAQDLSKMIQQVYVTENKSKEFNIKFSHHHLMAKNTSNKTKFPKKRFFQSNISVIKKNTQQNNYGLFLDQPDENYGLRKFKRNTQSKNKQLSKNKQKTKSILCFQSKNSKKNIIQNRKKEQIDRIGYSPLTPKPISISKMRMGWGENLAKNSRHSSKSYTQISKKSSKKLIKTPNNKLMNKNIKQVQKGTHRSNK